MRAGDIRGKCPPGGEVNASDSISNIHVCILLLTHSTLVIHVGVPCRPALIPGIFWGEIPPLKLTISPSQAAAKLRPLNLSFGRDNELQIRHGKHSFNGQ